MLTDIYLVRHGEVKNPREIFYGRLSRMGLSEVGKKQAVQAGRYLKDQKVSAIYASPLLRTRQTAQIIAQITGVNKVNFSIKLLEVKTHFQGEKLSNLDKFNFDLYSKFRRVPGDETMEEIKNRSVKMIEKIIRKHGGKRVVVVGHGDPLMMLRLLADGKKVDLSGLRPKSGYLGHAEVVKVVLKDKAFAGLELVFTPNFNN